MKIRDSTLFFASKIKNSLRVVVEKSKSLLSRKSSEDSIPNANSDSGDEELGDVSTDRFIYRPKTLTERIAVGVRVKNKLSQSRCVKVPYRVWCKYLLVVLLALIGAFFTPQLLPKWLGFEWASPKDLCMDREFKLSALHVKIENLTRLPELRQSHSRQNFDAVCMNTTAANFYKAPTRFQWPTECTPEMASDSLTDEVCVGPSSRNVCDNISPIRRFFANIAQTCKSVTVPKTCKTVVDKERTQALLDLEREEAGQRLNESAAETQPVIETANDKATEVMNRLLLQVDIASDVYIAYSIVSIIIGMPLIIYKREKGSRILGAAFGMQKLSFIIAMVVFLSFYDSFLVVLKESDFSRMFRNFRNDPCYIDAEFSRDRVGLIVYACNNVTELSMNSSTTLQEMDGIYFTARRFGICTDTTRPVAPHPRTDDMDKLRIRYRDGDLKFSGVCNATYLNEATSTAPADPGFSKFRALMGSGVLAQLLLKFLLTSWLVHLFAFREPMVVHNGKIEIWDTSVKEKEEEGEPALNKREVQSAKRFARDKHLLPLIVLSMLMIVELFLIIYSIFVTHTGRENLRMTAVEELDRNFTCPFPIE